MAKKILPMMRGRVKIRCVRCDRFCGVELKVEEIDKEVEKIFDYFFRNRRLGD